MHVSQAVPVMDWVLSYPNTFLFLEKTNYTTNILFLDCFPARSHSHIDLKTSSYQPSYKFKPALQGKILALRLAK